MTVTEVNDAPVAANDTASVAEDSSTGALINVSGQRLDWPGQRVGPDADAGLDHPRTGARHRRDRRPGRSGTRRPRPTTTAPTASTTRSATTAPPTALPTPSATTATVNVTVTEVNDAPVAADDTPRSPRTAATAALDRRHGQRLDGPGQRVRPDADADSITRRTGARHRRDQRPGRSSTRRPADYNGPDSFTLHDQRQRHHQRRCRPQVATTATVNFTVTEVNDAPVAADDTPSSVAEDSGPQLVIDAAGNDSTGPANEAGQTLTDRSPRRTRSRGTAVIDGRQGPSTRRRPNYNGPDSFTTRSATTAPPTALPIPSRDTATVNFTVTEVNDAPVAADDARRRSPRTARPQHLDSTSDGQRHHGPGQRVRADADADSITRSTTRSHGTVVIEAGTGPSTRRRPTSTAPPASTTRSATTAPPTALPIPGPTTATVNFTVTEVNDAPVAADDTRSVAEDSVDRHSRSTLHGQRLDGPGQRVGQTLTLTRSRRRTAAARHRRRSRPARSSTRRQANYNGPDIFTYKVSDNGTTNGAADPKTDTGHGQRHRHRGQRRADGGRRRQPRSPRTARPAFSSTCTANDSTGPANESGQTLTMHSIDPRTSARHRRDRGRAGSAYTPTQANYNGPDSFTYKVCDNGTTNGAADPKCDEATVNVTVTEVNDAPVVTAGANQSGNKNDTVSVSASFTDVEAGDTHMCSINWGDGSSNGTVVEPSGATPGTCTGSHKYLDDNPTGTPADNYTVTITVTDDGTTNGSSDSKSDSDTLTVGISNLNPVITGMTGPSWSDSRSADRPTSRPPTPTSGPGHAQLRVLVGRRLVGHNRSRKPARKRFVHRNPHVRVSWRVHGRRQGHGRRHGLGHVEVRVRRGLRPERRLRHRRRLDHSPAGAYAADPALTGKANFGFVSKYQKGATVPTGKTEFQFQPATSTSTARPTSGWSSPGAKAQYKGTGTINGGGSYGFLLTASDGQPRRRRHRQFRIKIWDERPARSSTTTTYGGSDDIDPPIRRRSAAAASSSTRQ